MKKILLVDDESSILDFLAAYLEKNGYETECFEDAEKAIAKFKESPFDAVISDVKMPVMNGLELMDRVKEHNPNIARVILSGHADIKLVLDAVNRGGIDRYLTKPWEDDEMASTIRQCIELFNLRHERDTLLQEIVALRKEKF